MDIPDIELVYKLYKESRDKILLYNSKIEKLNRETINNTFKSLLKIDPSIDIDLYEYGFINYHYGEYYKLDYGLDSNTIHIKFACYGESVEIRGDGEFKSIYSHEIVCNIKAFGIQKFHDSLRGIELKPQFKI